MQVTYWDIAVGKNPEWGDDIIHPSRKWLTETIRDESVLELGFGTGKDYQNLTQAQCYTSYRGYDSCPSFVDLCRERFGGDFRLGNALAIPEQTSSWDTVLCRHLLEHTADWKAALFEAFRVARKRVIVIFWRPLAESSHRSDYQPEGYCWDIGIKDWYEAVDALTSDRSEYHFDGPKENWAWVLEKNDVCFDLDDFCQNGLDGKGSRWEDLKRLKDQFPNLKVTLFAIPMLSDFKFLQEVASHDWVELAVHGLTHHPNTECKDWTVDDTYGCLDFVESMGCFTKGFKAPGWMLNRQVVEALKNRGYWLAHHTDYRKTTEGIDLPVFWSHHPWMVHGHMHEIHANRAILENGLTQLCQNGPPFHDRTRFHFVSELCE